MAHYGLGTREPSEEASYETAGEVLADDEKALFSWDPVRIKAFVFARSSLPGSLFGLWNAAASTTVDEDTDWDFELQPGDYAVSPSGIVVTNVALHFRGSSNATLGQHFQVRGWD